MSDPNGSFMVIQPADRVSQPNALMITLESQTSTLADQVILRYVGHLPGVGQAAGVLLELSLEGRGNQIFQGLFKISPDDLKKLAQLTPP